MMGGNQVEGHDLRLGGVFREEVNGRRRISTLRQFHSLVVKVLIKIIILYKGSLVADPNENILVGIQEDDGVGEERERLR